MLWAKNPGKNYPLVDPRAPRDETMAEQRRWRGTAERKHTAAVKKGGVKSQQSGARNHGVAGSKAQRRRGY